MKRLDSLSKFYFDAQTTILHDWIVQAQQGRLVETKIFYLDGTTNRAIYCTTKGSVFYFIPYDFYFLKLPIKNQTGDDLFGFSDLMECECTGGTVIPTIMGQQRFDAFRFCPVPSNLKTTWNEARVETLYFDHDAFNLFPKNVKYFIRKPTKGWLDGTNEKVYPLIVTNSLGNLLGGVYPVNLKGALDE